MATDADIEDCPGCGWAYPEEAFVVLHGSRLCGICVAERLGVGAICDRPVRLARAAAVAWRKEADDDG